MFMPSERIWREMQSESVGFWPVPINFGNECAFLAKLPTGVIKAAFRSAPVGLAVATANTSVGQVLASVLYVADDPAAQFSVSGIHRHPEEQLALTKILMAGRTLFVFFDELSRPVARAVCVLDPASASRVLAQVEAEADWYTGPWSQTLVKVLDEVDALADPTRRAVAKHMPTFHRVGLSFTGFETNRITTVGEHQVIDFWLENQDEGHGLEQSVWHLLEHLFAGDIVHSPQVVESSETRELTDILGVCSTGCLLVETKAAAVLSTDMNRSTVRRSSSVEKQIDKGLGQISGALRNLSAGRPLLSPDGTPFGVEAGSLRVCVVLVSELLPAVDWKAVASRLVEMSVATAAQVLVLDLSELRTLVGASRTPEGLLSLCVRRYTHMVETGTAFIRSRLDAPPPP